MKLIEIALSKLQNYIEKNNYTGYDLYDGLKITDNKFLLNNYFFNTAVTQFFKHSPLNFRKLFRITPSQMPKALGIILNAYCKLIKSETNGEQKEFYLKKAEQCKNLLIQNSLKNYSGACWNFGFNYKFMFDKPTVVITSIIAKGLHNYFLLSGCEETRDAIISIKDFILKDLHITETNYGICFSYTPAKPDCCYNANMLAAETLSCIYSIGKDESILKVIKSAVDFTVYHQKEDGRWNYSIEIKTGKERQQVDFHQGYVLESLFNVMNLCSMENDEYRDALIKGADFYFKNQFDENGRSFWRYPKKFPADIHYQAQGIITFSLLKNLNEKYLPFAKTIAEWTIKNMQDESGYFYYQVNRFYKNKISYMRWADAWMFLALSKLKLVY